MAIEPLDLDAIRARAKDVERTTLFRPIIESQHDVRPLLAEIDRLRAHFDERLADVQAEYARAAASWDRQRAVSR